MERDLEENFPTDAELRNRQVHKDLEKEYIQRNLPKKTKAEVNVANGTKDIEEDSPRPDERNGEQDKEPTREASQKYDF
jgi:hypothetical protein